MYNIIAYTTLSVGVLLVTGVIITCLKLRRRNNEQTEENEHTDDNKEETEQTLETLQIVDIDVILEELENSDFNENK